MSVPVGSGPVWSGLVWSTPVVFVVPAIPVKYAPVCLGLVCHGRVVTGNVQSRLMSFSLAVLLLPHCTLYCPVNGHAPLSTVNKIHYFLAYFILVLDFCRWDTVLGLRALIYLTTLSHVCLLFHLLT